MLIYVNINQYRYNRGILFFFSIILLSLINTIMIPFLLFLFFNFDITFLWLLFEIKHNGFEIYNIYIKKTNSYKSFNFHWYNVKTNNNHVNYTQKIKIKEDKLKIVLSLKNISTLLKMSIFCVKIKNMVY